MFGRISEIMAESEGYFRLNEGDSIEKSPTRSKGGSGPPLRAFAPRFTGLFWKKWRTKAKRRRKLDSKIHGKSRQTATVKVPTRLINAQNPMLQKKTKLSRHKIEKNPSVCKASSATSQGESKVQEQSKPRTWRVGLGGRFYANDLHLTASRLRAMINTRFRVGRSRRGNLWRRHSMFGVKTHYLTSSRLRRTFEEYFSTQQRPPAVFPKVEPQSENVITDPDSICNILEIAARISARLRKEHPHNGRIESNKRDDSTYVPGTASSSACTSMHADRDGAPINKKGTKDPDQGGGSTSILHDEHDIEKLFQVINNMGVVDSDSEQDIRHMPSNSELLAQESDNPNSYRSPTDIPAPPHRSAVYASDVLPSDTSRSQGHGSDSTQTIAESKSINECIAVDGQRRKTKISSPIRHVTNVAIQSVEIPSNSDSDSVSMPVVSKDDKDIGELFEVINSLDDEHQHPGDDPLFGAHSLPDLDTTSNRSQRSADDFSDVKRNRVLEHLTSTSKRTSQNAKTKRPKISEEVIEILSDTTDTDESESDDERSFETARNICHRKQTMEPEVIEISSDESEDESMDEETDINSLRSHEKGSSVDDIGLRLAKKATLSQKTTEQRRHSPITLIDSSSDDNDTDSENEHQEERESKPNTTHLSSISTEAENLPEHQNDYDRLAATGTAGEQGKKTISLPRQGVRSKRSSIQFVLGGNSFPEWCSKTGRKICGQAYVSRPIKVRLFAKPTYTKQFVRSAGKGGRVVKRHRHPVKSRVGVAADEPDPGPPTDLCNLFKPLNHRKDDENLTVHAFPPSVASEHARFKKQPLTLTELCFQTLFEGLPCWGSKVDIQLPSFWTNQSSKSNRTAKKTNSRPRSGGLSFSPKDNVVQSMVDYYGSGEWGQGLAPNEQRLHENGLKSPPNL